MKSPDLPAATDSLCNRCGCDTVSGGICPACVITGMLAGPPAADGDPDSAPPRRVGDYDLQEELARGGMGVVWRARQRRLQREVALKFVLHGVLPGEVVAWRFRQEAELAAQLSHPHIISVYEVGEADGRYFISMELAPGGTLAQRLASERFTPRECAELVSRLARAIQHAHDRGVLHRDLKPGNVLFDGAGEPRISDFGLARLTTERSAITVTGAVMGTPSYMSPEQARGEARGLTTAADIYGLGMILYEMLAGRPAFAGEVPLEVLRRVVDEEPPAIPGRNRDLDTICRKCLAKSPEDRYRSARLLADDLERWMRGEPIHARRASVPERIWKWGRRRPVLAALSLALLVAAVIIASLVLSSRVELARARGAAEASEMESRHRRADQHTTAAILAIERGDSLRALPSLAAAIRIGTGDPARDRVNRVRFGSILQLAPVLERVWYPKWVNDLELIGECGMVAVSQGKRVSRYRISDGEEVMPPMEFEHSATLAMMHPLRRLLVQSGGEMTVWDPEKAECLSRLPGRFVHNPWLFHGGVSALVLSYGSVVRRYNVSTFKFDGPELMHPAAVIWGWLCRDGVTVVTFAQDRRVRVWDSSRGEQRGPGFAGPEGAEFLAEIEPGRQVQLKFEGDRGLIVDLVTGLAAGEPFPAGDIRAYLQLSGQPSFARATREGFVVSDAAYGNTYTTATHGTHGNDASFTRDGLFLLTRSVDSAARLWSISSGKPATPFLWQGADPLYHDLSATGDHILVSNRAPEVKLWRLRPWSGAVSETPLNAVEQTVERVRYRALDSRRAVAGPFRREAEAGRPALLSLSQSDLFLHVRRNASDTEELLPPLPHHARIVDAQFSPDGRIIASFTTSQCVYLWDAATGRQIGPLLRHDRGIESIEFSPDSRLLLATGAFVIRIWETASGTTASPPLLHAAPVQRAYWRDDSAALFSIDIKGSKREWSLAPDMRPDDALEAVAQLYSAHQVTNDSALAPLSLEAAKKVWEQSGKNAEANATRSAAKR